MTFTMQVAVWCILMMGLSVGVCLGMMLERMFDRQTKRLTDWMKRKLEVQP